MLGLKEQGVRFHVNVPLLPGLLQETKENAKWLEDNNIKYIYRKIHPMYTDTDYNMPYQSGVNAKLSKPKGLTKSYYSDEELLFLNSIEKMNHSDNIILETKTGEEIYTNVNMVFTKNLNDFRTWTCNAGIETLYIHNDGNIYRGNCKFGGEIGNINTDFQLPTEPIICGKEKCNCAADLFTTKWS